MNKLMQALNKKYIAARIKMDEFMKKEDGMETLEVIILVVVAVIVASVVINILTKGDDGKGLIGYLFDTIKTKIDDLFNFRKTA